jgi:hypothetical protein
MEITEIVGIALLWVVGAFLYYLTRRHGKP